MNKYYPNMFKPLRVGSVILKNRVIASPQGTNFLEKAKGGACLVTIGSCPVNDDRGYFFPGYGHGIFNRTREYCLLINNSHQYGALIAVQLFHCGMWGLAEHTGKNPMGPSKCIRNFGKDRDDAEIDEMTESDIYKLVDDHVKTALHAKRIGFDMIMLHFAHGWLAAQFLSPYFNKRTDKYGGNFENRIRFPRMIVDAVRDAIGPDFPIQLRISGDEWIDGGINPAEVIKFVQLIEKKIDIVNVSAGIDKFMETSVHMTTPFFEPHKVNLYLAANMKKAVNIPVITVGGFTTPEEVEETLASGVVDAVAIGRALTADPQFVNKAKKGMSEEIVPCLRCLNCYHVGTEGVSEGCSVNPYHMREARLAAELKPAMCSKKVAIIGGGPAGMKAAVTAAEFGHNVKLYEKSGKLGGQLTHTDYDEIKFDLNRYKNYIVDKTLRSKVEVNLNSNITTESLKDLSCDVLIIGIGAEPVKPNIPGIDLPHVYEAVDAYARLRELGKNVVIIGGGPIGCEFAMSICKKGHSVFIVEAAREMTAGSNLIYKEGLKQQLDHFQKEGKLDWALSTKCKEIRKDSVVIVDADGKERLISSDAVVYSIGMKAKRDVAQELYLKGSELGYEVRMIGDCIKAARVTEATHNGFFAGATID